MADIANIAENKKGPQGPFYLPTGHECDVFERAFEHKLPLLLKGPTGCGKTRFVEHMAARLDRPLYTISCHDDLTAADLTGRFLLKGGETVWGGEDRLGINPAEPDAARILAVPFVSLTGPVAAARDRVRSTKSLRQVQPNLLGATLRTRSCCSKS